MKVTLLKISRKKEVINRLDLQEMADLIRQNPEQKQVFNVRLNYQFLKPQRLNDGRIIVDDQKTTAIFISAPSSERRSKSAAISTVSM